MGILQIATACLLSISLVLILWLIKGFLLRPVIGGTGARITVAITANGNAREMEHVVSGLKWLRQNGTLRADILIVDDGLGTEAQKAADIITKYNENINFCTPEEIGKFVIRGHCHGGKA